MAKIMFLFYRKFFNGLLRRHLTPYFEPLSNRLSLFTVHEISILYFLKLTFFLNGAHLFLLFMLSCVMASIQCVCQEEAICTKKKLFLKCWNKRIKACSENTYRKPLRYWNHLQKVAWTFRKDFLNPVRGGGTGRVGKYRLMTVVWKRLSKTERNFGETIKM